MKEKKNKQKLDKIHSGKSADVLENNLVFSREEDTTFVPLAEIAKNSTYSKNYINFSARQGKLKAKKIGGVWHTTEEWLAEFTKNSQAKKNEFKEKLSRDLGGNKKFVVPKEPAKILEKVEQKDARENTLTSGTTGRVEERRVNAGKYLARLREDAKSWLWDRGEMEGVKEIVKLRKAKFLDFLKLDYAKPAVAMIALVLFLVIGNFSKADLGYWGVRQLAEGRKKIYTTYNDSVDVVAKVAGVVSGGAQKNISKVRIGKEKFVKIAQDVLRREKIEEFEKNSGLSLRGNKENKGEVAGVETSTSPQPSPLQTGGRVLAATTATAGAQMNVGDIEVSAYLMDEENKELTNGEYEARFGIYTTDRTESDPFPSDTDQVMRVWEETQTVVIENGLLKTYLGAVTPIPANFNFAASNYYIGIRVGEDSEMIPRKRIGAVPLARTAMNIAGQSIGNGAGNIPLSNGILNTNLNADLLDGQHATAFQPVGNYLTSGSVTTYAGWKMKSSTGDTGANIKSNKAAVFSGANGITTSRNLSTLTISPTYGSAAGTIAEGSTSIIVNTTGNLSGGGTGTAGGGLSLTLDTVASPTFSSLTLNGTLTLGANAIDATNYDIAASGVITGATWNGTDIDISDYTNLAVGGTLLQRVDDALSVREGILTNNFLCSYVTGTGLVCNTDPTSIGISYWNPNGNHIYNNNSANVGIGTSAPGAKLTVAGAIGFLEGGVSPQYYTYFQGGDQGGNLTYTWPGAYPAGDGYILTSLMNGTMSWTDAGAAAISLGSTISGGATPGAILYIDGANKLAQDPANFFWNYTDKRIGIGTSSPQYSLDVAGDFRVGTSTPVFGSYTLTIPATGTAALGTGIANYVARWTGTNTLSTGVFYDNGTNVGIGTTGVGSYKLNISGNVNIGGTISGATWNGNPIDISSYTNLGVGGTLLQLAGDTLSIKEGTLTNGYICKYVEGTGMVCNTDPSTVGVSYFTAYGNDIASNNSGNVGIGITSPLYKLDVAGDFRVGTSTPVFGTYALTIPKAGTAALGTGAQYQMAYWSDANTLAGSDSFWFNGTNVGIGTTGVDTYALNVNGDVNVTAGNGFCIDGQCKTDWASVGTNYWQRNGTTVAPLTIGDNIGIGTTAAGQTLSVAGTIGILEGGTSPQFYTVFQGGDQSGNITYTLPTALPGLNNYVLTVQTDGTLSWESVSGVGGVDSTGASANYLSKFVDDNTITNSALYETGGN
ncbi:MAG: hypothetical protein V1814_02100, partial [Candidatus Moraniibacteriota bacterium]